MKCRCIKLTLLTFQLVSTTSCAGSVLIRPGTFTQFEQPEKMLEIINPNGEVDGDDSPRIIIGPSTSFDASSVTDLTNHSALGSIMTNYDYAQYEAVAAHMEAKAAHQDPELEDYESILDDDGFGIHKSRPVADDELSSKAAPSEQVEEKRSVNSKTSLPKRPSDIHATTRCSSGISVKSKRSSDIRKPKKDAANKHYSHIRRLFLFRGRNYKSGINAIKEKHLATPESDSSSTELESPFSDKSFTTKTETPVVTNSSVGRRTPNLVEPPSIPIASPHIASRRIRSQKLLEKFIAIKVDDGSASTARLTDDDTSEGDANSTNATREPKEIDKSFDSPLVVDRAAQDIFRENVICYDAFFTSHGSEDAVLDAASLAGSSGTPLNETESKNGIFRMMVQPKKGKQSRVPGLSCINKFETRKISYDGSLCDDEDSIANTSARTFDSIEGTFACNPCGIGEVMDDVSDALQSIARVFHCKC